MNIDLSMSESMERCLADGRWTCIGWPETWGGRVASIEQQVIFMGYARAVLAEWGILATL